MKQSIARTKLMTATVNGANPDLDLSLNLENKEFKSWKRE